MMGLLGTARNHWKKSVFFAGVSAYGADFSRKKWADTDLMRSYCSEALAYGQRGSGSASSRPYHVTVVLNPAANSGKCRANFDKYCAPILHLAGMKVSVVRTEGQGQAKDLMAVMDDTDAVLVAGGDGTLMETITGVMRRPDCDHVARSMPIGILPLGEANMMARNLFPGVEGVALMAEAAMSVVRQLLRPLGVVEVKNIIDEGSQLHGKAIYGLRQVQVGAFADAHDRVSRYWYWGPLKKYMAYVQAYTTSAPAVTWKVAGRIQLADSSAGQAAQQSDGASRMSWWSYIVPGKSDEGDEGSTSTSNNNYLSCPDYAGTELTIASPSSKPLGRASEGSVLTISQAPDELDFVAFSREGFRRENVGSQLPLDVWKAYEAASMRWLPDESLSADGRNFYLDNEAVDIRGPLQISLIPDKIAVFCPKASQRDPGTGFGGQSEAPNNKKWWQNKPKQRLYALPGNVPARA